MPAPSSFAVRLALTASLLGAQSLPRAAQTWFEMERELPAPGQLSGDETLMEVDLDSLRQEQASYWMQVRVSWSQPRPLKTGLQARSLQAWVEVLCPSQSLRWNAPRFYSERQAQGLVLALAPEEIRSLQAGDWLPGGGQARLIQSACGRAPFKGP